MKLGISSYTYTWAVGLPGQRPDKPLTAADLLDRAAELAVDVVQFADNLPLHELGEPALEALGARAAEVGIAIEVGTRGIAADILELYLAICKQLSSSILRVVTDTADHHPTEDEVVAAVRAVEPALARAGVCLAIENHDRFPAACLVSILERIGSPQVGICLDTANSFGALEGPEVVIQTLAPWTVNLHVKDFAIRRAPHMMGFAIEGRPAGRGRLNIPHLLDRLRGMGRNPNAILELWTPPEENLPATIAKEEAWAAESIRYLRRLLPKNGHPSKA
jgi:sugar phosphate isomerase/epimerase